ncbi:hypothetical protein ACRRTK_016168 [Alexandromys fortis]
MYPESTTGSPARLSLRQTGSPGMIYSVFISCVIVYTFGDSHLSCKVAPSWLPSSRGIRRLTAAAGPTAINFQLRLLVTLLGPPCSIWASVVQRTGTWIADLCLTYTCRCVLTVSRSRSRM